MIDPKRIEVNESPAEPPVRCPRCDALLFTGVLIGTIRCRRCRLNLRLPAESVIPSEP
jgi:phage FluMu protein Com